MSKTSRRRGKLSEEELEEVQNFVYRKNAEEDKFLQSMSVNIKCKNENQKLVIESIKNNEITIVSGLPGTGKAQPLTSKVLTPNGWVTMGEIKLNDYVTTPKGDKTKVTGVYPQGLKDIYKITFSDGREVESCDEHLWKVYYRQWADKYRVLSLRDVIDNHSKKIDDGRLYIPLIDSSNNEDVELPINPYLLGSLIGDGGMTNNSLTFSNQDEEVLELVGEHLDERGYQLKKFKHGKYDYGITSINKIKTSGKKGHYTNLFKLELGELNLYGKKSENKFIPTIYKNSSKRQKLELIQGLMDTDGTTDTRRCSVSFSTSSKQLCEDFVDMINSIGGITKIYEKSPTYTYKGEVRNGLINYIISIRYPNPEDLFMLKRKKNICKNYQYKNLNLRIKNIEYVGKKESQCIMISDDNHLYVTDNYITTHNTYLACAEALKLIKSKPKYKKILLVKSVIQLPGEELGFLPGDLKDKLDPYMISFIDNFEKIIGESLTNKLRELGLIQIQPLAFVRGRSIDNTIIIIDEAQNISIQNMRTLMTRIGDNSKMVILGDVKQKDIKNPKNSSLEVVIDKFEGIDGFGCVSLRNPDDVVRNPVIKIIEKVFEELEG
jgi:phosphate starvation-inducible protein PhoH